MSISPRHSAINPPTPAPSPQPDLHASLRHASALSHHSPPVPIDPNDASGLVKHLSLVLPQLSQSARFKFLSALVDLFDLRELAHLSAAITPKLNVDFLSALPIEVSIHILSFIDDPKTLARASCVSRFWRSLVNDEYTWKVMCLKHKYRRRGFSSAGLGMLDDRYLHSNFPIPRLSASTARQQLATPRPQHVHHTNIASRHQAADDDSLVLASLYQRYRARGLDPSNALDELRALHDLFLSKQEGNGHLTEQMSQADRAFYAQLEEIVSEESRERYGDSTTQIEQESFSFNSLSDQAPTGSSTGSASNQTSQASSNLGWLSAGPSSANPRYSPLPSASHSYLTPDGHIDRLRGWQDSSILVSQATNTASLHASTANAPVYDALGLQTVSNHDDPMAMDMDDDNQINTPLAVAASSSSSVLVPLRTPHHFPTTLSVLPTVPHHDSPTGRFSTSLHSNSHATTTTTTTTATTTTTTTNDSQGSSIGSLIPGPSRRFKYPSDDTSSNEQDASSSSNPPSSTVSKGKQKQDSSGPTDEVPTDAAAAKKLRRGSTEGLLGLNRPFSSKDITRAVTIGSSRQEQALEANGRKPFSYRTHFKMAYLTESNWLRSGRLQTQHVSTENGVVVTCLAIDAEWIVVGMTNSKIHVFDARTGLFVRTLLGHESGVWCLTLVSRSSKKPRSEDACPAGSSASTSEVVVTDPEDGVGGKPYQATAHGDLRLVYHDPRSDASSTILSPETNYTELLAPDHRAAKNSTAITRSTSHSSAIGSLSVSGNPNSDQTLEWFHKARKAMLRQASTRPSESSGAFTQLGGSSSSAASLAPSQSGDLHAEMSVDSDQPAALCPPNRLPRRSTRLIRSANDEAAKVAPATTTASSSSFTSTSSSTTTAQIDTSNAEYLAAAAIAEAEAGVVRDAVMADGTGQIPANLAQNIGINQQPLGGGAFQARGNAAGHGNPCGSVCGYGNDDAVVVSGGCDRDIRVWDLKTGECKHVLRGHTSTTRCLKILDGRPIAVSGSRDSTLRVWNIESGQHMHLLAGHQHSVRCVEVAGNRVASGSYDCTCRVWNAETGQCVHVLRGHVREIYAVAFDGKKIATGSLDSTVRVWDAETGACLALFQGHTLLVGQLQLLDDILVTGGSDGRVIVFSLKTYECLHRLCAHDNSVTCLQFDDRYIITGGNDGRVKLWDFATGKFLREIGEPCDQVWKVSYRDDKVVVLCKRGEKTYMDVITFRPTAEEL